MRAWRESSQIRGAGRHGEHTIYQAGSLIVYAEDTAGCAHQGRGRNMSHMVQDGRTVRRARYAVAAVFTVHGAVTGSFATRVPWIQEHASLGTGQLGLA